MRFPTVLIALLFSAATPVLGTPIVSVDVDPITPGPQFSAAVPVGAIFTIDIFVENVQAVDPLNAYEFDLGFDNTKLAVLSVISRGFLLAPRVVAEADVLPPEVNFAELTLLPAGAIGSGVLASISFEAFGRGRC